MERTSRFGLGALGYIYQEIAKSPSFIWSQRGTPHIYVHSVLIEGMPRPCRSCVLLPVHSWFASYIPSAQADKRLLRDVPRISLNIEPCLRMQWLVI